jgi:hypothetical protein
VVGPVDSASAESTGTEGARPGAGVAEGGPPAESNIPAGPLEWRTAPSLLTFAGYLALAGLSSDIVRALGHPDTDGLKVITAAFFGIIVVCMFTQRTGWPLWKRIAFLPASFLAHVALTIPAAATLGVLMHSPDHVRTLGEQRAVFLMASFPILILALRQSRVFVRPSRSLATGGER